MLIGTAYMGLLTPHLIYVGFMTFLNALLGFCLIYSITMLAGLLTATVITHIVLAGIFTYIIPLVILLVDGWFETFFITFYSTLDNAVYVRTSHLAYFVASCAENKALSLLCMLAASAIFTVICFGVCKIRRSEATETALAFERLISPLRIFFSVVLGVTGGFIFREMFGHLNGEVVFTVSMLVISVISSVIIEVIFRLDFTAALKNKKCIVITAAICAAMIFVTFVGAKSYNSYVPSENRISSAAISISRFRSDEDFRTPLPSDEYERYLTAANDYNGEKLYGYNSDGDKIILDNMNITDTALIRDFLTAAAEEYDNHLFTEPENTDDIYTYVLVKCTLASGRAYYRNYYVDFDKNVEIFRRLVDSQEYKEGFWTNIYNMDPDEIKHIDIDNSFTFHNSQSSDIDPSMAEKLTEALKTDYKTITLDQLTDVSPIARIRYYNKKFGDNNYNWDIYNSGSVFIYSSFRNTIELLKELGFREYTDEEIIANIKQIGVYGSDISPSEENLFTSRNDIEQIYPYMMSLLSRSLYNSNIYLDVYTYADASENKEYRYEAETTDTYSVSVSNKNGLPDCLKKYMKN